jgi:hypothetical protein
VHAPSGHDHQIGAPLGVAQKRFRRGAAAPFMGCGLVEADALLLRTVEVLVVGKSRLLRGTDERPGQRMTISPIGDLQRPGRTMILAGEPLVAFQIAKDRKHLVV